MQDTANFTFEIYTFPRTQDGQKGIWAKHAESNDRNTAMKQAERLFRSCKFDRVQVEQLSLDTKTSRQTSKTLKVFEGKKKAKMTLMGMIGISTLCVVWAFMMMVAPNLY